MDTMSCTNNNAPVELFAHMRQGQCAHVMYRRFANAAEAVRFAVEDIPTAKYVVIEADDNRIGYREIRKLYERRKVPDTQLKRRRNAPAALAGVNRSRAGRRHKKSLP
jgi:hypothetical protein